MKKLMIKSISLAIILVMSASMLFSCSNIISQAKELIKGKDSGNVVLALTYPTDWTAGGYYIHHEDGGQKIYQEGWWVETYDELMIALDKLKYNGSSINNSAIINYDGDLFDVKYCIVISHASYNEFAEYRFGDDPFERCLNNVSVYTVLFFEKVTIDQINYSDLGDYKHSRFITIGDIYENHSDLPFEEMSYKHGVESIPLRSKEIPDYRVCIYNTKNNSELFYLDHKNHYVDLSQWLNEHVMSSVINSIEYLYFDNK